MKWLSVKPEKLIIKWTGVIDAPVGILAESHQGGLKKTGLLAVCFSQSTCPMFN